MGQGTDREGKMGEKKRRGQMPVEFSEFSLMFVHNIHNPIFQQYPKISIFNIIKHCKLQIQIQKFNTTSIKVQFSSL